MSDEEITGGCYCGAIRYASSEPPSRSGMCHCRMCQRWTGAAAATGVQFDLKSLRFTQGEPAVFKSSPIFERYYCRDCGTAIMAQYVANEMGGPGHPYVYVGTLDHPEAFDGPHHHFGVESHLPDWLTLRDGVPTRRADDVEDLQRAWSAVADSHESHAILAESTDAITGGCYCGAVRYQSTKLPVRRGMCHCRMCQRWTGAPAAMGVFFDADGFSFTEEQPKHFMTSEILERHFCADCGTTVGHRYQFGDDSDVQIVFIGTLDEPSEIGGPQFYFGIESHLRNWIVLRDGAPQIRADTYRPLAEAWAHASGQTSTE